MCHLAPFFNYACVDETMDFEEWNPIYKQIIEDFGYDRHRDEEAAIILSKLVEDKLVHEDDLKKKIENKHVVVCGDAPSMKDELLSKDFEEQIVIAADGATSKLLNAGIIPDIVVTDLDGTIGDLIYASRLGSIMVVHAHGDNIDLLERTVSQLNLVMGTTQSRPHDNIHNFGGFTDGDRCVCMARHFGAKEITLLGFDFDDPTVGEIKHKKLIWAKRIIETVLG